MYQYSKEVGEDLDVVTMNRYSIEKQKRLKEKMEEDRRGLQRNKVTAVEWLEYKIKELGGELLDTEVFRKEMLQYIEATINALGGVGLVCTSPTFISKKHGRKSFRGILEKQGVGNIFNGIIISINIRPNEVLVVDSTYSRNRYKLRYDESEGYSFLPTFANNSFQY